MAKTIFDYFIVGQGIAGTMLSYFLLQKGKSVLVFDDGHHTSASTNALGVCNPVRGRNLKLASENAAVFPFARETYKRLEDLLGCEFCRDIDQIRFFLDAKQRRNWERKKDDHAYAQYFKGEVAPNSFDKIACELGGIRIAGTFYMDGQSMLPRYRAWLEQNAAPCEAAFEYDQLKITGNGVRYGDKTAKTIVFCEGYRVYQNPFFDWLPHTPMKGEWLTVKFEDFDPGFMINKSLMIIPVGNGEYRAGATFDMEDLTIAPTEDGRNELIRRLERIMLTPFEIVSHAAGIRPKTKDNQPILGRNPEHGQLAVFGGWGSIGFIQTPFYASEFADYLEGEDASDLTFDLE